MVSGQLRPFESSDILRLRNLKLLQGGASDKRKTIASAAYLLKK
jgi:hypothetical protein